MHISLFNTTFVYRKQAIQIMRVISVLNHKGGVGKTTTSVNLAAGLARLGKRTLAIDFDGQANLSFNFGLENKQEDTIYHALRGDIEKLPIYSIPNNPNLFVVPSHLDLGAVEMEVINEPAKEYFLKELIEKCADQFDYIIIDCAPALSFLAFNALTASTDVIIPIEADGFAVKGTIKVRELISKIQRRINPNLSIMGLLITKYDQRKNLNKEIAQYLTESSPIPVLTPYIRTNVSLSEASLNQLDIFQYAQKSQGAEDYLTLSKNIINGKEK